jgi:hypothetical protein
MSALRLSSSIYWQFYNSFPINSQQFYQIQMKLSKMLANCREFAQNTTFGKVWENFWKIM